MTIKRSSENQPGIRSLDAAELETVNGGSVTDLIIDPFQGLFDGTIISPRDPASGLPTGKRMHKPFVFGPER